MFERLLTDMKTQPSAKASRRAKAATAADVAAAARGDGRSFVAWMAESGVEWDAKAVRLDFGDRPGSGGVFAASTLREGDVLCRVPKTAILSTRTTACAEMLERERLGGALGLTVAVMYEVAIGEKSKW